MKVIRKVSVSKFKKSIKQTLDQQKIRQTLYTPFNRI